MSQTEPSKHYTPQQWSAYADREVPLPDRDEMRAHLEACAACAALARSFEAVQRGAEELARRSPSPSSLFRSRLLAVAVAVLGREKKRKIWLLSALSVSVLALAVAGWFALRPLEDVPPQHLPPAVTLRLNDVQVIREFIYGPQLEFDITIRNTTKQPVTVTRVLTADPIGGERQIPYRRVIEAGETIRDPFFVRRLPEAAVLPAGRYRIALILDDGSLTAEKILTTPKKP